MPLGPGEITYLGLCRPLFTCLSYTHVDEWVGGVIANKGLEWVWWGSGRSMCCDAVPGGLRESAGPTLPGVPSRVEDSAAATLVLHCFTCNGYCCLIRLLNNLSVTWRSLMSAEGRR